MRGNNVPVGQVADRLLICGNDRVPEGEWHPLDATKKEQFSTKKLHCNVEREAAFILLTFLNRVAQWKRVLTEKTGLRVSTAVKLIASAWKD